MTDMTLDHVGVVQAGMLRRGSPSTAFGKYQMTRDTRTEMQKRMGLSGQASATEGVQDRLMRELLQAEHFDDLLAGRLEPEAFQRRLAGRFASFAEGPRDYVHQRPGEKPRKAPIPTADIQASLTAAKAEHERYLQTDPYIRQRIEEGYMPDVTRWR